MSVFLIPAQCFTKFYMLILKVEVLITKDVHVSGKGFR